MKHVITLAALAAVLVLSGCNRTASSQQVGRSFGAAAKTGARPVSEVAPCCRDFALYKINIDQCYQNPQCKANNNQCCMQAVAPFTP